jgi:tryptophan 2,3-dioxygenase
VSSAGGFGEDGGRLTYGDYLRLPQLLGQQVPQADPPAHDELLFITVHQAYELWFKQLLHELEAVRDAMRDGAVRRARHLFRRSHVIERLMVEQVDVLETMSPQDFLKFRETLRPASGFQSVQFRELEFLSGAKDPDVIRRFRGIGAQERDRLDRRLAEPSLWDAYVGLLARRGLPVEGTDELMASLTMVAREAVGGGADCGETGRNGGDDDLTDRRDRRDLYDLWELAEGLLTHDELAAAWRVRHAQMVERQIGTKSGTGGSSGNPYLRSRTEMQFFPLLWELRTRL